MYGLEVINMNVLVFKVNLGASTDVWLEVIYSVNVLVM